MLCGNRRRIKNDENQARTRRLCAYYEKMNEIRVAQYNDSVSLLSFNDCSKYPKQKFISRIEKAKGE